MEWLVLEKHVAEKCKSSTVSSSTVENTQQKIKRLEAENELLKKLLKM